MKTFQKIRENMKSNQNKWNTKIQRHKFQDETTH